MPAATTSYGAQDAGAGTFCTSLFLKEKVLRLLQPSEPASTGLGAGRGADRRRGHDPIVLAALLISTLTVRLVDFSNVDSLRPSLKWAVGLKYFVLRRRERGL